jgi:diguanylate cyclase (GGDEF)-like protein
VSGHSSLRRHGSVEANGRSVSGELSRALGLVLAYAVFVMVSMVALLGWLRWHIEPQRDAMEQLVTVAQDAHVGLVDEETGLRAYLSTGQPSYLTPYNEALPVVAAANRTMPTLVATASQTSDLLALQSAQNAWVDGWAKLAIDPATPRSFRTDGQIDPAELSAFLGRGKELFDAYRSKEESFVGTAQARGDSLTRSEHSWLAWSAIVQGLVALCMVGLIADRRRRLTRAISQPVSQLMAGLVAIRDGREPQPMRAGPAELREIAAGVEDMAAALATERAEVARTQRAEALHTARLGAVLAVAREVSGSLNIRYVMEAVATNAVTIAGAESARLWLSPEDPHRRGLDLAFDTSIPRGQVPAPQHRDLGVGVVGRAARYGRPIGLEHEAKSDPDSSIAVPMMVGGVVTGVLECRYDQRIEIDQADMDILETLASHAAVAIEAARVHEQTRELAVTDALTGLSNRRAFDEQFESALSLASRYDRPLSVIYCDLDHFKVLNDTYGHAYGDSALQQVATVLLGSLRTSDRAYRYGGEELVIIAPETRAADALALAERLRKAVEAAGDSGGPRVTASFGVAEFGTHGADPATLLAASDRALRTAKDSGRNQVVLATAPA